MIFPRRWRTWFDRTPPGTAVSPPSSGTLPATLSIDTFEHLPHRSMKATKIFLSACTALFAVTANPGLRAQAAAPATASTATKKDAIVVQSVATATANTLADKQQISLQPAAASVINVIKFLPGVSLSQGDAIGGDDWSTRINIRGFTESQLGFTVDGVTTGYTAYGGGAKPNRHVRPTRCRSAPSASAANSPTCCPRTRTRRCPPQPWSLPCCSLAPSLSPSWAA